jgi:NAD(P)-dependent dehydrogenase (short-subunit alcohol dehydrogenase family)
LKRFLTAVILFGIGISPLTFTVFAQENLHYINQEGSFGIDYPSDWLFVHVNANAFFFPAAYMDQSVGLLVSEDTSEIRNHPDASLESYLGHMKDQISQNNTVSEPTKIMLAVVNEINSTGKAKTIGRKCDVSVVTEVNDLVKEALNLYGSVDVLINNAGISYVKKVIDTSEEEWDQTLDINLKGAFLFCKAIVPYMMKKNLGVIVNVSSGAGKVGFEDISAYCASKFGMIGFAESLAWEVANYNIRVMTICPGEVATRMQEDVNPRYYESNKHKMLNPRTVAEKLQT